MLVDKNGKLFGKVSLIDIGVALLIILCAVGLYLRFAHGISELSSKPVEIEYVYEVKKIRQPSVNALMMKGNFYNNTKASQDFMGTITNVEAMPNDDFSELVDGTIVKTSAPERYDALVTVRVRGRKTESAIFADSNQRIEVGSRIYLASKWVACEGTIKSIKILD